MNELRTLNNKGIKEFEKYLHGGAIGEPPFSLLNSSTCSKQIPGANSIQTQDFSNRFEFGKYLNKLLDGLDSTAIAHDKGLWTWLALHFFDQLCPKDVDGQRKVFKSYAYVLSAEFRHYYRHLVRTPYILFRDHGTNSRVLLMAPLHKRGELSEQIISRQNIIARKSIMEAVDTLYYDSERQTFKRGAAGRGKPGTVDRLVGVLQQFELTYDLHVMNGEQIVGLLPKEFDKFINN